MLTRMPASSKDHSALSFIAPDKIPTSFVATLTTTSSLRPPQTYDPYSDYGGLPVVSFGPSQPISTMFYWKENGLLVYARGSELRFMLWLAHMLELLGSIPPRIIMEPRRGSYFSLVKLERNHSHHCHVQASTQCPD